MWVGNLRSFYTVYATVIESVAVDFQIFLDNKNNIFVMKLELKIYGITKLQNWQLNVYTNKT